MAYEKDHLHAFGRRVILHIVMEGIQSQREVMEQIAETERRIHELTAELQSQLSAAQNLKLAELSQTVSGQVQLLKLCEGFRRATALIIGLCTAGLLGGFSAGVTGLLDQEQLRTIFAVGSVAVGPGLVGLFHRTRELRVEMLRALYRAE